MRLHRIPPVVHWCNRSDEYLNIPVDLDDRGCRIGECPYCGQMFWEDPSEGFAGIKGGELGDGAYLPAINEAK